MAVKKLAQQILDDLKAVNEEKSTGPMSRETLKAQQGQVLVISGPKFRNILKAIFPGLNKDKKALDAIWNGWTTYLSGQGSKLPQDRKNELQDAIDSLQLPRGSRAFMITSYTTIRKAKSGKGKLGELIKANYKEASGSGLDLIGGQGSKEGAQLGHEEGGIGVATSGVAAASAEARLRKLGFNKNSRIIKHIYKYYDDMQMKIEHTQIVDAKGGIQKKYVPILFWQASKANQGKQLDIEREFTAQLQRRLSSEIATMEGSTPLKDAVEMVLFDAAAPDKKRKGTRTAGQKKKRVKDRSVATAKARANIKREATIRHDDGVDAKSVSAIARKQKTRTISPFSYVAMINKTLSRVIRKNMRPPALQNQTGGFANSVRVQDVNTTRDGYLSFGYTYQKDPYQVFEVGKGTAPWSTAQRDPRKLIDKSIREVAAELALGRFYTRRL